MVTKMMKHDHACWADKPWRLRSQLAACVPCWDSRQLLYLSLKRCRKQTIFLFHIGKRRETSLAKIRLELIEREGQDWNRNHNMLEVIVPGKTFIRFSFEMFSFMKRFLLPNNCTFVCQTSLPIPYLMDLQHFCSPGVRFLLMVRTICRHMLC